MSCKLVTVLKISRFGACLNTEPDVRVNKFILSKEINKSLASTTHTVSQVVLMCHEMKSPSGGMNPAVGVGESCEDRLWIVSERIEGKYIRLICHCEESPLKEINISKIAKRSPKQVCSHTRGTNIHT